MAEENVCRQEFKIRNLPTRSVTLYPSRAHVIRDIKDVTLKVSHAMTDVKNHQFSMFLVFQIRTD